MDDYSFLKPISPNYSSFGNSALDGIGGLSSLLSSSKSTKDSTSSDFKDMLVLMMKNYSNSTMMSGLGIGGDSSSTGGIGGTGGDMFGGMSSSMMMMPLMISLLEKVMELDTQDQSKSGNQALCASSGVQINQFDSEAEGGGDGINADCGPASLLMGLHSLGLRAAGETSATSSSEAINLARLSMVSDPGRDGVDENGNRSDLEHNTFTNLADLVTGAQAAGAKAKVYSTDPENIRKALEAGAKVLVSGTFEGKASLPWTGDRGNDNQSAPGFAGDHIVALTGYNADTNRFVVNDPARSTPLTVDAATLSAFMSGNAGAVILYE